MKTFSRLPRFYDVQPWGLLNPVWWLL